MNAKDFWLRQVLRVQWFSLARALVERILWWGCSVGLLLSGGSAAASTWEADVPAPLRPWVDWAMHGIEDNRCPVRYDRVEERRCAWPSSLELDVGDDGALFRQQWTVDARSWLPLPGDLRHWPREVSLDGDPVTVIERDGRPIFQAQAGKHSVSGRFSWSEVPESLQLPKETALLKVTLGGRPVANPRLEDEGRVWLRQRSGPRQEDHLEIQVYRLITDGIPLTLDTRLQLAVSGQAREIVLGRALPENFTLLALESPLPARLESAGKLRLQLKPGNWLIELSARHRGGPVKALTLPQPDGPWADQEIWSFQAVNALRMVSLEGAPSIDPAQTRIPDPWRHLPAYLMEPDRTLRLVTRRRGDADPAPDRLALEKTLWLDFDGGGYTVQDRLTGTISQSARLEAGPETRLGRVAVNGQDQFITRLADGSADGVELRQGNIQLTADSRLDSGDIGNLPAVGWQITPLSVRAVLNLPPGWRALGSRGADSATTWLDRWNLLDIFIVLLIALSFARLWGWPYGVLALLGMVLVYHEPNAPRFSWLSLLAAIALLRVLALGRLRTVVRWYRGLALLIVLVVVAVFATQQVRSGLYPQLAPLSLIPGVRVITPSPPLEPASAPARMREEVSQISAKDAEFQATYLERLSRYAPDIQVQTGPGLPDWQWDRVVLDWGGPVPAGQRLRLWLLSPWASRLLTFTGVILLLGMLMRCLIEGRSSPPRAGAAVLLLPLLLPLAPDARADIPTPALLKELRQRLSEAPDCQPICAKLSALHLRASNHELWLSLELHSQVQSVVPLPLAARHLMPLRVYSDGQSVPLYRDADGVLWARLPPGRQHLEIEVKLPAELSTFQIPLPMRPGHMSLQTPGWQVEGVYQGSAEGQIQLTRQRRTDAGVLRPGVVPTFLEVNRELVLGVEWRVETRVRRLSQADAAAVLEIPLLAGERVTTPGVRVRNDRVQLNLSPRQQETRWSSVLDKTPRLELEADASGRFAEIWRLRAEPLWHVEASGIAPIHRHDDHGQWLPQWQPWPSETLALQITRPIGVEGKTVTIDSSRMQIRPGKRLTEVTLDMTVRSSRGMEHTLTLPPDAKLSEVAVDGESQPIKQSDRSVVLPLTPGTQRITLNWRGDQGIAGYYRTPLVDLGADSVNSRISLSIPRDRWTLLVGGPRLGPAVLFWGVLIVIILGAVALGRFGATPLRPRHWFLLGVGLSQAHVLTLLLVAGWLLLLARRERLAGDLTPLAFNALQILLALLTVASLVVLLAAIQQGLLGAPEMQIAGNRSDAYQLNWYQDRSPGELPQGWAISVPLLLYRGLMLVWALWLAFSLLKWLGWGWRCFSSGGLWQGLRKKMVRA